MSHPWTNVCSIFYWRPRFWKDIMFHRDLWWHIHEYYDMIVREEKILKSILSRDVYDEYTMNRVTRVHGRITSAWHSVKICGNALREMKTKSKHIQITPLEFSISSGYRSAAYKVFRECRELFLDAEVRTGRLSLIEREECIEYVRKQRYQ